MAERKPTPRRTPSTRSPHVRTARSAGGSSPSRARRASVGISSSRASKHTVGGRGGRVRDTRPASVGLGPLAKGASSAAFQSQPRRNRTRGQCLAPENEAGAKRTQRTGSHSPARRQAHHAHAPAASRRCGRNRRAFRHRSWRASGHDGKRSKQHGRNARGVGGRRRLFERRRRAFRP